jgi:hypothetical protein
MTIISEPEKLEKIFLNQKIDSCKKLKHYQFHKICLFFTMRNDGLMTTQCQSALSEYRG